MGNCVQQIEVKEQQLLHYHGDFDAQNEDKENSNRSSNVELVRNGKISQATLKELCINNKEMRRLICIQNQAEDIDIEEYLSNTKGRIVKLLSKRKCQNQAEDVYFEEYLNNTKGRIVKLPSKRKCQNQAEDENVEEYLNNTKGRIVKLSSKRKCSKENLKDNDEENIENFRCEAKIIKVSKSKRNKAELYERKNNKTTQLCVQSQKRSQISSELCKQNKVKRSDTMLISVSLEDQSILNDQQPLSEQFSKIYLSLANLNFQFLLPKSQAGPLIVPNIDYQLFTV